MKDKKALSLSEQLEKMRNIDIMSVDKDELVDINDVVINTELPENERIADYLNQIKNPYLYKDNGIVVKIEFSGKKSLEDCVIDYLRSLPQGKK